MDILIEALLRNGKHVELFVFPNLLHRKMRIRPKESKERVLNGILEIKYPVTFYPYYHEKYMNNWRGILFDFVRATSCLSITRREFANVEVVVLESGYPVLLANKVPENIPVIYRQSDPVELVISQNKRFASIERELIARSHITIVVKKNILDYYQSRYPDLHRKMILSVNGFNIPDMYRNDSNVPNPYEKGTKNAVYLGYAPLDFETLEEYGCGINGIDYHIIGDCMNKKQIQTLSIHNNLHFYGNLPPEKYLPYIKHADLALVPYKRTWKPLEWAGLSSKYLLFMFFNLPIISYRVGAISEFEGLPVTFCDTPVEFIQRVREISSVMTKIDYKIDWDFYSREGRITELEKRILSTLG